MNVGNSSPKEDCLGVKSGSVFTDHSQEETEVQAETAGGKGTQATSATPSLPCNSDVFI